jgi:hypothetical protein
VKAAASRRIGGACGCPSVGAGIVSPASIKKGGAAVSTPDDHLGAGPDCRVNDPASWRAGRAGGCPTVGAGIISAAGVEKVAT